MKLTRTLQILLGLQLVMYMLAVQIAYSASHDDMHDMSGLGVLFPLAIFLLLGVINSVIFIAYIVRYVIKGFSFDIAVAILVFINIVAVALYNTIFNWAASGPT